MKQTVTDLNDSSELAGYLTSRTEQFTFDTFFGEFPDDASPEESIGNESHITQVTFVPFSSEIVHNVYNVNIYISLKSIYLF